MVADVMHDLFALIRVEGMHAHTCERAIQRALLAHDGVNEVEVDFPTGQASVLYDGRTSVPELMAAIEAAGYHAAGCTLGEANR